MRLFTMLNFVKSFMGNTSNRFQETIEPITSFLAVAALPILGAVLAAGSIYAVVLGIHFAKAEDAGKRDEVKKRIINAIVGIVVIVLLLVVAQLFSANVDAIFEWIQSFIDA